jgi:hypothetical protein
VKIPAQVVEIRRTQGHGELLSKGRAVQPQHPREMPWDQEANRPGPKRAQQFGVALQEGAKVDRSRSRDDIDEGVRALQVHADRQLIREVADRLGVFRSECQRRQILARDSMGEREMRELVLLCREPRATPIGQDGVEDHESFDGTSLY